MHILVVNDDGPPSTKLSPYLRPLINTLEANGHQVSVAIPAASRSWIGKAHLIEASLTASYVHPDAFHADGSWDTSFESPDPENDWVVIRNGTPASCAQLGLYNLFSERAPIDLVISGPNHGRNASTIYNLSSGTVGGALEAVFCGKRSIAISFGSKDPQADDVIAAAARLAVRVVRHLYENWDDRVELYNINIPMCLDVEERPVLYTRTLPYYWSRGCLYAEQGTGKKVNGVNGVNGVHVNGETNGTNGTNGTAVNGHTPASSRQRQFKWSADLSDMKKTLQESEVGTDAHTVLNGSTSVTALRANFWHVPGLEGPLNLDC
ncbi:Survival protein SurE-like phosphatase/nucleotidase [Penicillium concentricum]|uniref:Survival protein SurE-like phosphatase/nucleotidase n=1 Tax=Penicillium concentricum TaxID=293559 RepID=A0A9W9V9Q7_9EURO|nr:Survival protein SurE-like phosphatase/nucleotidase [Penicillium concentricum]KAJ5374007.1 Survival protein SurE-like phosphatase/nucleotidase [Penicillium concentricum]